MIPETVNNPGGSHKQHQQQLPFAPYLPVTHSKEDLKQTAVNKLNLLLSASCVAWLSLNR